MAIKHTPADYLGWDNNPDTPEYQARIQSSKRIAENMIKLIERQKQAKEAILKATKGVPDCGVIRCPICGQDLSFIQLRDNKVHATCSTEKCINFKE